MSCFCLVFPVLTSSLPISINRYVRVSVDRNNWQPVNGSPPGYRELSMAACAPAASTYGQEASFTLDYDGPFCSISRKVSMLVGLDVDPMVAYINPNYLHFLEKSQSVYIQLVNSGTFRVYQFSIGVTVNQSVSCNIPSIARDSANALFAELNGQLHVFGGSPNQGTLGHVNVMRLEFDGTWTASVGQMLKDRVQLLVCQRKSKALTIGGWFAPICELTTDIFDANTGTNTLGPSLTENVYGSTAHIRINDTHALIYGGWMCVPGTGVSDTTWLVDINTIRMVATTTAAAAGVGRKSAKLAMHINPASGKLVPMLYSGIDESTNADYRELEFLDLETGTWGTVYVLYPAYQLPVAMQALFGLVPQSGMFMVAERTAKIPLVFIKWTIMPPLPSNWIPELETITIDRDKVCF